MEVIQSGKVEERGSEFQAYAIDVQDLDQVRNAYIKVRKLHSSDTHVMCAHKLSN